MLFQNNIRRHHFSLWGGEKMKSYIMAGAGVVGSAIAGALGGWDTAVVGLCSMMALDYLTGLGVALIAHKSNKSESGGADSRAGFRGLIKKCAILAAVVAANVLDMVSGSNYIRDGVCIAYCVNEALSMAENLALLGVPFPKIMLDALEVMNAQKTKTAKEGK
jgi:toxin secretion/phage lysis holin